MRTSTFNVMTATRGAHRLVAGAALAMMLTAVPAHAQDATAQPPDATAVQDVVAAAQDAAAKGQAPAAVLDDPSINGFAVEDAVKPGADVHFKIQTDAQAFSIAIYRYWNGEATDELRETLPAPSAPQVQPACQADATTGAIDCSNWSQSAAWTVPDWYEAGTYYALLRRADTGGVNHILFVVASSEP